MKTCERVLRPGDVYYDIGSNSGVYSIDAALTIPDLTVYASEPQPSLAYHIRRSIEANGLQRVRCLEVLLGQKDGESVLHIPSHSMHASIVPREERSRELRLPMRTLDSLIMSKEIEAPDVIKIDVEGAETTVFEGARQTLRTNNPSVICKADENLVRMGLQVENVFDCLSQAAPYTFYRIDPDGNLVNTKAPYRFGNYLALARRHLDRI